MRPLLATVSLGALLAGLWIYWQDMLSTDLREARRAMRQALAEGSLSIDTSTVRVFRIRRNQGAIIAVRRLSEGGWMFEAPFHAPADSYAVDRALGFLRQVAITRRIALDAGDQEEFGLQTPLLVIELESDLGVQRLTIGKESPVSDELFAEMTHQDGIVLLPKDLLTRLPRDPSDLLDRHVVPLARDPLHTIEVKHGGTSLLLKAGGQGWSIDSPIQAVADRRVMMEWITHLAGLEARRVFWEESGNHHRRKLQREGQLVFAAGNMSHSLELARSGHMLVARRSDKQDLYYEVAEEEAAWLFPDLFRLYDKHLIHMETGELTRLEVRDERRVARLERNGTGWTWEGRHLQDAKVENLERWIQELNLTEATAFMPEIGNCGTGPSQRWTVTLKAANGHRLDQVVLSRTRRCGDIATPASGITVRLRDRALIDQLQLILLFKPPAYRPAVGA
ncbi:DUF4340 domain-containing protein [Nitrospira sp. Nam80]